MTENSRYSCYIHVCSDQRFRLQIDPETPELLYEFEVKCTGGRKNLPLSLIRVMLLHPYKAFRIQDKFNVSAGADVQLRLHPGMTVIMCLV
jgi:hypothetical protein